MFHTIIEPRVSETDGVGHINNTTVPVWLEAGRNQIFALFTPDHSFQNWKMIIVNMNVDYVGQIYFGKKVDVFTWVKKLGNSSLVLYEEIYQDGRLCVRGTAAYVNYNMELKQSEPIPANIREILETHYYQNE
ncbi:acyl-CoA thioesterase [Peribacillus deserti]|uniref:Thioesterase n=1 Tax=Peribacillus deserti TaxID=673318 RepID=A0A2N5M8L9_9BACI|nr:thioesterase family protein [Peribacillus deserti]PLT30687.1 thioesterase [Peribacillus deserti]